MRVLPNQRMSVSSFVRVIVLPGIAACCLAGWASDARALNCEYVPSIEDLPGVLCAGTSVTVKISITPFAADDVPVELMVAPTSGHPGIAHLVIDGSSVLEGTVVVPAGAKSTTVTLNAIADTDCSNPMTLTASTCADKPTHPSVSKTFYISSGGSWLFSELPLSGSVVGTHTVSWKPGGWWVLWGAQGVLGYNWANVYTGAANTAYHVYSVTSTASTLELSSWRKTWTWKDSCGRVSPCPATARTFNYVVAIQGIAQVAGNADTEGWLDWNGHANSDASITATVILEGDQKQHQVTPPTGKILGEGAADENPTKFSWKVKLDNAELGSGTGASEEYMSGPRSGNNSPLGGSASGGGDTKEVVCKVVMQAQSVSNVSNEGYSAEAEASLVVLQFDFQ